MELPERLEVVEDVYLDSDGYLGEIVGNRTTNEQDAALAAEIARRYNAHAALVAALESLVAVMGKPEQLTAEDFFTLRESGRLVLEALSASGGAR